VRIAQAARTRVVRDGQTLSLERRTVEEPGCIAQHLVLDAREGEPVTIEKVVTLFTSKDRAIAEPGDAARGRLARLPEGFDRLLERHVLAWGQLWRRCHIDLGGDGDQEVARTLNLHVFHLLQTVSEHTIELDVGVPARGLHGEAYRGHVFWDELFIFPFLNLRFPELTRALLRYRARRLPQARQAAKAAGYAGAMYPWQSGSDGREETQLLHLNPKSGRWLPDRSHRQRHVNIAVAYNVWQYYQVTGDLAFLSAYGAKMLLEIARFWATIARYDHSSDRFKIRGVMGPDEYHDGYPGRDEPGLDNNAYTNVMAAWVLCRALETLELLPDHRRTELTERLGLRQEETDRWDEVSRKLRVCFQTATSSASSKATATSRSWTGTAYAAATAASAAWTGSWRLWATPPTATGSPSRLMC
jgi:trehalose/maltose hydrolase-like predicted phosphorylase